MDLWTSVSYRSCPYNTKSAKTTHLFTPILHQDSISLVPRPKGGLKIFRKNGFREMRRRHKNREMFRKPLFLTKLSAPCVGKSLYISAAHYYSLVPKKPNQQLRNQYPKMSGQLGSNNIYLFRARLKNRLSGWAGSNLLIIRPGRALNLLRPQNPTMYVTYLLQDHWTDFDQWWLTMTVKI